MDPNSTKKKISQDKKKNILKRVKDESTGNVKNLRNNVVHLLSRSRIMFWNINLWQDIVFLTILVFYSYCVLTVFNCVT